jgi:hypothetical protein
VAESVAKRAVVAAAKDDLGQLKRPLMRSLALIATRRFRSAAFFIAPLLCPRDFAVPFA